MPFGCFSSRAPAKSSTASTAAADALPHGDEVATSTITQRQNASILGLLVGDAAGAVLEFSGGAITAAKADRALTMPGGGIWRVGPGQITDDGELALCLLQALRKFDSLSFDPVAVRQESARMYSAWFKSQPFDMGQTCGQAFGVHRQVEEGADLAAAMAERASKTSQANGALMRSAPIPAWLAGVDDQDKVIICARNDALLSHAHPACQDCNVAYCLAIWHLIRNPGDREGALQRATLWAESHGGDEVKQWLQLSKAGEGNIEATKDIGHVKWAFLLAFHHLRHGSSVQDGIRATLLKGGDTDTNAAIGCAMLGALHGAVPPHLTAPVLAYKTGAGRPRPGFLTPSCVLKQGVAFPARRPGGSNGGSNNKHDSGQP